MKYEVKITIDLLVSGDTAAGSGVVQEWTNDLKRAIEDCLLENEVMVDFKTEVKEVKEDDTRIGEKGQEGT